MWQQSAFSDLSVAPRLIKNNANPIAIIGLNLLITVFTFWLTKLPDMDRINIIGKVPSPKSNIYIPPPKILPVAAAPASAR